MPNANNDNKFTQTFVLPDGSETKVLESYMGRYLALPIQRIFKKPEHQKYNSYMEEKWKNSDCRKIEVPKLYMDRELWEEKPAIETMILAENKNWVEYPLASLYTGEHAVNCEYFTKIEVVLMDEEYSRRLFFSWKGTLTLADFIDDCAEQIMEKILEAPDKFYATVEDADSINPTIGLEFYTNDGASVWLELCGIYGIANRIASVRVVEFIQKVVDEPDIQQVITGNVD
jgi:hypothetical protein